MRFREENMSDEKTLKSETDETIDIIFAKHKKKLMDAKRKETRFEIIEFPHDEEDSKNIDLYEKKKEWYWL